MKSSIGLIGLGVMGTSLARNIARNNYKISLYNRYIKGSEEGVAQNKISRFKELSDALGFDDLTSFVASMERPRKIILMLTAGAPVDEVIQQLLPLLESGDLIIDAGNSHYKDSQRRFEELNHEGILFMGLGVSGGEEGALRGPSLMPGGSLEAYELMEDVLKAIAAKQKDGTPTSAYVGDGGAGHFVKMVHNGIEYAEMQLIAELFEIMHRALEMSYDQIASIFESWNQTELKSYLLGITAEILRTTDDQGYVIDRILDSAAHKGTGSWSLTAAVELGQPSTLMAAALFARFSSSKRSYRTQLSQCYAFENSTINLSLDDLKATYSFARIINHHQGLSLIQVASKKQHWEIDLGVVCSLWTEGCIIKSKLLYRLIPIVDQQLLPLSDASVVAQFTKDRIGIQNTLASLVSSPVPSPALSGAYEFFKQSIQSQSSAHMIQAQRDYFGAHGYELTSDADGRLHHYNWKN